MIDGFLLSLTRVYIWRINGMAKLSVLHIRSPSYYGVQ